MPKRSAGILAYRFQGDNLEVLLVHPGGPFYAKKDLGVWSIPKGEFNDDEDPLTVARREFEEETGNTINGHFIALQPVKLKSGKVVSAWAVEADFENCFIRSNTFEMEWPPSSGKMRSFPEVDKAGWFPVKESFERIHPSQQDLIRQLQSLVP